MSAMPFEIPFDVLTSANSKFLMTARWSFAAGFLNLVSCFQAFFGNRANDYIFSQLVSQIAQPTSSLCCPRNFLASPK